jgi:transposase
MKDSQRYRGLKLTKGDRQALRRRQSEGKRLTARIWRRIQILLMLDRGMTLKATAESLGTYRREVGRVARRYLEHGLDNALGEQPRAGGKAKLDSTQEAALVALVCGPAPEGRSRWTIRLLTEQAVRRGIVDKVGRETVRVVLAEHELKPWREKNVVRAGVEPRVHRANGKRAEAVRAAVRVGRAGGRSRRATGATA